MAKATGTENKDRVKTNGATSNGTVAKRTEANGVATHDAATISATTLDHSKDLKRTNLTRTRQIGVTAKHHQELVVLTNGLLSKPESVDSFLDFIASDRLRRVPHRGSHWDKILRWAEYFAIQISILHESVGTFVPNSTDTAQLIWASCQILLQMGPQHSDALDNIFGVLYKMSLPLTSILRNSSLFAKDDAIQEQLVPAYAELLTIVVEITITYQKRCSSKSSSNADDLDKLFGGRIDSFFHYRDHVSNAIWRCQLEREVDVRGMAADINIIREWLAPQDRTLRLLTTDMMNSSSARVEFTCEWFQSNLLEFTRSSDDMFLISGSSGSGKSILSGWIAERLQRVVGRKSFDICSVTIDSTIKTEATSLGVIKRLLLQSLEHNVGNLSFYKVLCAAYEISNQTKTSTDIENALWRALDKALDVPSDTMIIVNGLDQMIGGEAAIQKFLDRLHEIATKHQTTKCIVLSHPLIPSFSKPARQFSLQPKNVRNDLRLFIDRSLGSHHHFHHRHEDEKQAIVQRIVDCANGSFILASYTTELLRRQESHEDFTTTLRNAPRSISEAIQLLVSQLDLSETHTKRILSWLLVSERPLTLTEIRLLFEIDISGNGHSNKTISIEEHLRRTCGPLIEIRDSVVRFRHISISQHLLDLSRGENSILSLHDAHCDLTYRCLVYANTQITKRSDCRMDSLDSEAIEKLFEMHQLLEYTTRYWTTHFCHSAMYRSNGKHEFTSEFRRCFAPSILLVQIEGSCWESQSSIIEALEMHQFALSVRKELFTESSEVVLQSLINIGRTYERISRIAEASDYYYRASQLSQTILGTHSTITTNCAEAYITSTRSTTVTTRTEIINRKEEMLKVVIASHKHCHGFSSEEAIQYSKLLAQLYTERQENSLAARICREVYEACVEYYGEFHSETVAVSRDLTVIYQRESRYEDLLVYHRRLYEKVEETMDVIDIRRLKITLRLVEINEYCKDLIEAEELIVTLWRRIAMACHLKRSVETHERKIEVTLAYVKFLRRQSRYVEAENLLRGLWIEYEREVIESESLIIWIKAIGEELNELRILDVAVSVFRTVWSFFKKTQRQHTVEATSVAIYIAEITTEIRSQEETYTETTYTEETILKEVYECTLTTILTTTVTKAVVKTCETLSAFYVHSKRWAEALSICQAVLKQIWSKFERDGDITISKGFAVEGIDMAIRIAHCHLQERQIEKAERIFTRVFRAAKSSLLIQDELMSRSVKELISFYETTGRSEKNVEVYRELFEEYSCSLGKTHTLTVEVLYRLGDLCLQHGRKEAEEYYLLIYGNLTDGSDICHHGAIEAALALAKIYESDKRWAAAHTIYCCLWKTVVARTKEYNITSLRVDEIYRRYFFTLEKEVKVNYTVLRQTTIEFREVCVKAYGARAEISLKATLRLAEICERSEKHVHEAIEIYEKTFKEVSTTTTTTTKTTTTTSIILEAKSRLTHLYANSTTSTEYTSKAVTLYMEQLESKKIQYGCSHESTITTLEELCSFYKSRHDQELLSVLLQTLQVIIVEIIVKEKDSRRLFDSSTRLARIYIAHGYRTEAHKLLVELRRQMICRDTRSASTCGFKVDHLVDRRSFVFLATFEEILKDEKTVCFSEIMADFLLETILHDAYTKSLTKEIRFETTLVHGARLRYFRRSKYSALDDSKIEDELFEAFQKQMGSCITTNLITTRYFFRILIEETGRSHREAHLVKTGCTSGTAAVHALLEQSKFQEAIDLSICIREFTTAQKGYCDQENINTGFKLALYLAGRNAKKSQDQKIRQQMLALSKSFLEEILEASRQIKVDFTRTPIIELNELVSLLAEVGDFNNLEWVLAQLWDSRHANQTWSPTITIWIGRRLVECKFAHGSHPAAIRLLEDICYNLRRVWGPLDPTTLEMETLRSQVYTAAGSHAKAMRVHEEILQHIVNDDDDEANVDIRSRHARNHLDNLKRCHQRLGTWDKDAAVYHDLYEELVDMFRGMEGWSAISPISKWPRKLGHGDDHQVGVFKAPSSWEIVAPAGGKGHQNWLRRINGLQRWDSGVKRMSSPSGLPGRALQTYIES